MGGLWGHPDDELPKRPTNTRPTSPPPSRPRTTSMDELDLEPVIVTALYDFTASSPGTISVNEGDQLTFVSHAHDGWIVVRTEEQEGYIPLAYVLDAPLVIQETYVLLCVSSQPNSSNQLPTPTEN